MTHSPNKKQEGAWKHVEANLTTLAPPETLKGGRQKPQLLRLLLYFALIRGEFQHESSQLL